MATINPDSFGIATGRLARDPKVFENKDGSKSVRFTLMIRNAFKGADGNYGSQGIDYQAFVPKTVDGLGVYGVLKTGSLVQVTYEPRENNFTDKDGVAHYEQILFVTDVRIREPKSAAAAREDAVVEGADDNAISIEDLL